MAKRLPPPEPITFEELSATQVSGFDEFLRFRPGETSLPPRHATSVQEETGTVPFINTVPLSTTVPDCKPRVRIFRATHVEHAHTTGERIIYEALWRSAQGDQVSRTIQIGYDKLASLAYVNWKTARSCLKSLKEKLALETIQKENSNARLGKTYRIYSFTAILERRKAAGLEWVEKGRGVRFLKPGTVPASASVPVNTTVPVIKTLKDGTG